MDHHRSSYECTSRGREIVSAIVEDYDLPLGIIAPCNPEHELFGTIEEELYTRSTVDNTLAMLTNAGRFHAKLHVFLSKPVNFSLIHLPMFQQLAHASALKIFKMRLKMPQTLS